MYSWVVFNAKQCHSSQTSAEVPNCFKWFKKTNVCISLCDWMFWSNGWGHHSTSLTGLSSSTMHYLLLMTLQSLTLTKYCQEPDEARRKQRQKTKETEIDPGGRCWSFPGVPCGYGQGKTSYGVHFYAVAVGQNPNIEIIQGQRGACAMPGAALVVLVVCRTDNPTFLPCRE